MATGPANARQDLLPASPPVLSLLRVPGVVVEPTDERWLNGIGAQPEACDLQFDLASASEDFPYWWTCGATDPAVVQLEEVGGVKNIAAPRTPIEADSWQAWVGEKCTAMSYGMDEIRAETDARLRRKLEAALPAIVEHELWTGQVSDLAGMGNPSLMDANANTISSNLGFVTAMAEMEQALADASFAGKRIIHAQPRVVSLWRATGLVSLAPSRDHLLTELGTIVVPGTGYPGTSPEGNAASYSHSWIYGTAGVRVFLSTPKVDAVDGSTVTRATNDVDVRAERGVLILFDSCVRPAIGVNLCDTLCGAGS